MLGLVPPPVAPIILVGLGADVVLVIIALASLLVLVAAAVLYWPLDWIYRHTTDGIVGRVAGGIAGAFGLNPLGLAISRFLNHAMVDFAAWAVKGLRPFAHALWSLVQTLWHSLAVILAVTQYLAAWIDGSHQQLQAGLAAARAQEAADIQIVDKYVEALLTKEEADVAALTATLAAGLSAINAKEQADVAGLGRTIGNDVAGLNRTITTDVTALNQALQSDVLNLNNRITSVQTVLQNRESTDVRSLTAADATNLRAAENFALGAITGATPGIIQKAIAAVAPQLDKVKTELNECVDPLCDTVTPQAKRLGNVGKIFQGLEDLALVAFLMALTEEAVSDPAAVVEDTVSVFNAVLKPVAGEFRDAVGL
jgi:hypothetical protein